MLELEKVLEELRERNMNFLDLQIVDEINCQLDYNDKTFTTKNKEKLLSYIRNVYLKSDNLSIETITRATIDKFDELDDMSIYDLLDYACYY